MSNVKVDRAPPIMNNFETKEQVEEGAAGDPLVKKWSTKNPRACKQKKGKAVVIPLPVSMHTGQIVLLTKQLTARDMHFYDL